MLFTAHLHVQFKKDLPLLFRSWEFSESDRSIVVSEKDSAGTELLVM